LLFLTPFISPSLSSLGLNMGQDSCHGSKFLTNNI
jgi:hypothetical protein